MIGDVGQFGNDAHNPSHGRTTPGQSQSAYQQRKNNPGGFKGIAAQAAPVTAQPPFTGHIPGAGSPTSLEGLPTITLGPDTDSFKRSNVSTPATAPDRAAQIENATAPLKAGISGASKPAMAKPTIANTQVHTNAGLSIAAQAQGQGSLPEIEPTLLQRVNNRLKASWQSLVDWTANRWIQLRDWIVDLKTRSTASSPSTSESSSLVLSASPSQPFTLPSQGATQGKDKTTADSNPFTGFNSTVPGTPVAPVAPAPKESAKVTPISQPQSWLTQVATSLKFAGDQVVPVLPQWQVGGNDQNNRIEKYALSSQHPSIRVIPEVTFGRLWQEVMPGTEKPKLDFSNQTVYLAVVGTPAEKGQAAQLEDLHLHRGEKALQAGVRFGEAAHAKDISGAQRNGTGWVLFSVPNHQVQSADRLDIHLTALPTASPVSSPSASGQNIAPSSTN